MFQGLFSVGHRNSASTHLLVVLLGVYYILLPRLSLRLASLLLLGGVDLLVGGLHGRLLAVKGEILVQ
jgi:hypothetical protein